MYPLSRFKVVFDPLTLLLDIELNLALSSHHIVAAVVKNYEFPFSPTWSSFSNGVLGMMSTCRRSINFLVAKMDFETCRNLVIVPIILKS